MQGQSISKLIIAAAVMMIAVFVIMDVLTAGGNALGKVYGYLLFASAFYGLMAPKGAFVYLIVLTGYLDMLKRLMIFDSRVSMGDLYYVLGIAPAATAGILTNVVYSLMQSRGTASKGQLRDSIFVIMAMTALLVLLMAAMGRGGRALGDVVNTMCYLSLLTIVPFLYRTPLQMQKFYRFVLYIFIPAAIYMIYQSIAGLADWEMRYLRSGLTVEIRQLREVKFRPFGTFNSAASAAVVFGFMSVLALFGPWRRRDNEGRYAAGVGFFPGIACALLFACASGVTISRTGWVQAFIAVVCIFMFGSKLRTALFYGVAGLFSMLVIVFSSWIMQSGLFDRIEGVIRDNVTGKVALRTATISTFTDRMVSYQQLVENSDLWTPFGWKIAGKTQGPDHFIHDAVSDLLIKIGYVPLLTIAILGGWGLFRMHSIILSTRDPLSRRLGVVSAALFVASMAGCLATPAQLNMFPVNFFLWLFPAIIISIGYHTKSSERNMEVAGQAAAAMTSRREIQRPGRRRPLYSNLLKART